MLEGDRNQDQGGQGQGQFDQSQQQQQQQSSGGSSGGGFGRLINPPDSLLSFPNHCTFSSGTKADCLAVSIS